jgi:hypothetical protein
MRISDAIEHLKTVLPEIEERILGDARNDDEKNVLLHLFQKLQESLIGKNPMVIRRWLRKISICYKDKISDKNIDIVYRISELSSIFVKIDIKPVIFLSHSAKDLRYANPLRTFISNLGVPDDQIIYTSHYKHKIPLGENIYNYLAKRIHEDSLMINLWSNNYFESLACICETGAAWVSGCEYEKLCVPPLSFGDERFNAMPIDPQKMGIVLDGSYICAEGMVELGIRIKRFFKISDEQNIVPIVQRFMVEIT